MSDPTEMWRRKTDEQVCEAVENLDDYTEAGREIILAEAARRNLAKESTPEDDPPARAIDEVTTVERHDDSADRAISSVSPEEPPRFHDSMAQTVVVSGPASKRGSAEACYLVGASFLCIGAYFLLVNPSSADAELFGRSVVNLQRLYLGQTASIVGAIFLAAAMRPR